MQSLERLGPFFPGGRIGFLLVHGLAGTPAEMKILGKRLNRYGFTVLCPQLAGHCASEEELVTTCWSDWSRSVEDAFDALSRHMDAVFVGGLSAGAVLSLRHAQRYPGRARGLALYSTTLRYDGWTIPKLSFLLPLILKTPYFGKRYRFEEAFPYGIMDDKLRGRILAHRRLRGVRLPGRRRLRVQDARDRVRQVREPLRDHLRLPRREDHRLLGQPL